MRGNFSRGHLHLNVLHRIIVTTSVVEEWADQMGGGVEVPMYQNKLYPTDVHQEPTRFFHAGRKPSENVMLEIGWLPIRSM